MVVEAATKKLFEAGETRPKETLSSEMRLSSKGTFGCWIPYVFLRVQDQHEAVYQQVATHHFNRVIRRAR